MIVIVGCIVVLGAVLGGFMMAGGHIGALIHVSEFVTIGGASLGALIVMSPKKVLMDLIKGMLATVKGAPFGKPAYADLFRMLNVLAKVVRRDGFLALDQHLSDPHHSTIFQKYPKVSGNHHAMEFMLTALGQVGDGKVDPVKLTTALEDEIKVIEREHHAATSALQKTADALPGFGIVAAVLGIIITMQAIGGPAEEIGHKVGAALVGTFLGILLSYGFFGPLAGRMEALGEAEQTFFKSAMAGVVAIAEGEGPTEVVSRARRIVGSDCRPSVEELREIMKEDVAA